MNNTFIQLSQIKQSEPVKTGLLFTQSWGKWDTSGESHLWMGVEKTQDVPIKHRGFLLVINSLVYSHTDDHDADSDPADHFVFLDERQLIWCGETFPQTGSFWCAER